MAQTKIRFCAIAAGHLLVICIAMGTVQATDRPNRDASKAVATPKWLDPLIDPVVLTASESAPRKGRRHRFAPRRGPVHGKLVNNSNTSNGSPAFAIVDRYGGVLRYVEPVEGTNLDPHLGQIVGVRHDIGDILLASQLALPAVADSSGIRLAQFEEALPPGEEMVGGPNGVNHEGPVYLDQLGDLGDCPSCQTNTCRRGGYCGDAIIDCGSPCCAPAPKYRMFADYLLWQPRSTEVAYAVPLSNGVPVGPTATADVDYESGFRVGLETLLSTCSWLSASYTHYEGSGTSSASIDPAAGNIFSLVTHPVTFDPAILGFEASASLGIDLRIIDIDYRRRVFSNSDCCGGCGDRVGCGDNCGGSCLGGCGPIRLNYVTGVRYAEFDQDFRSFQPLFGGNVDSLDRQLNARVDFRGAGPKFGFEVETRSCCCPAFIYARSYASFLAGQYEGIYTQSDEGAPVQAYNTWQKDRLAPVLDLELGLGFCGPRSTCLRNARFSVGYVTSYWFNAVTTDAFIEAAQFLNYVELGDTISFDGLAARAEIVF
ncbi:MAG: Lpg1974 family pore-forming outer membrane protein [Pirellulales bacterium]|nr:Lpg1974 family pore-forming outer membrane protein [Pirellulales bacterium]